MAIAPTNPSAANVLVTSMGSLLFLFLCPQVKRREVCACSDGTSKNACSVRRVRACARYGVLVVGEEMKGLVNCNFLPGSARRLELGTVSPEPLSRAYWSQKLRPLGETVGLSRARTSGESPDSTQAGRGPQWPIQLAAISAHPAAMVGTGMPKLRGRTGNEP